MFAAATSAAASAAASFFKTSAISQNYILTQPSTGGYASSFGTSSPGPRAPESNYAPFTAGLWRVQEAVHKTNGKRVSVWTFDHKKNSALERLAPPARERVVEVLKAEVSCHFVEATRMHLNEYDSGFSFDATEASMYPG